MFDHLEWWQVILLLAPIMLIMAVIRRQEKWRGCTPYAALSHSQKTLVLLQLLPPSLTAKYLLKLEVHELETYLNSGLKIQGAGTTLHEPLIKEYLRGLASPQKDAEASNLHERLCKATLAPPREALEHLENLWPRPHLDAPSATVASPEPVAKALTR